MYGVWALMKWSKDVVIATLIIFISSGGFSRLSLLLLSSYTIMQHA